MPIDDTSYTYDPIGNPTSQTETRQGDAAETQCYGYDALDRLTQAWTATDHCVTDPSTNGGSTVGSGITGGAYWTSWDLDPLGQRNTQSQHGLSGAADTVTTYTYNTTQPNTLASTSTTGPGGQSTTSYGYDPAGNTTARTTPAQGQQTLTWSDDGQLTAVTGASNGSSYIYDANGQLLLQKDPGATTLYLPDEQIALNTATGAVTGNRFYALPGGGQAVRTGSGNAYSYETGDQHGTATLALDKTLTSPTWRQQTPYGDTRGTAPTLWPDNHGFLNQPQDASTVLTDVGARWYDPTIGRFASLDPVFEPDSPQQQNGYSYGAANPITNSDPNGTRACDGGTGDFACVSGERPDGSPKRGQAARHVTTSEPAALTATATPQRGHPLICRTSKDKPQLRALYGNIKNYYTRSLRLRLKPNSSSGNAPTPLLLQRPPSAAIRCPAATEPELPIYSKRLPL